MESSFLPLSSSSSSSSESSCSPKRPAPGTPPSPISCLPPEIILEIFETLMSLSSRKRSAVPFSIAISHVCQLWRQLAIGHTVLWSTISVDFPIRSIQYAFLWVERSGDNLLDLTVRNTTGNYWSGPDLSTAAGTFIKAISHRLRKLSYQPHHDSLSFFESFPNLEEAQWRCDCIVNAFGYPGSCVYWGPQLNRFWNEISNSPKFHVARFSQALPPDDFRWSNLTSVTFQSVHPVECLNALQACAAHLEKLSLISLSMIDTTDFFPSTEILLPALTHLHIAGMWSPRPLSNLVAPSLFSLSSSGSDILRDHGCLNMLRKSQSFPKVLTFTHWPKSPHLYHFIRLADLISPSLEVLDCRQTDFGIKMLSYLAGEAQDSQPPLPALKTAFLKVPDDCVSDALDLLLQRQSKLLEIRDTPPSSLHVHLYHSNPQSTKLGPTLDDSHRKLGLLLTWYRAMA